MKNLAHYGGHLISLKRAVPRAGLFAMLWWLLTAGHPLSWTVGLPTVLLATLASLALMGPKTWGWRLSGLLRFLPFFLWQSIRGGIDVMRRALHPALPLAPALVDYQLRLPEGVPRIFMANTISLLPGTLTAELSDRSLTLHVLDTSSPIVKELQVVESRIAALFGLELLNGAAAEEVVSD